MHNAINVTLLATILALVLPVSNYAVAAPDFDEDYYNECTLKNLKPGIDRSAVGLIQQACKYKATPKKCRAISDDRNNPLDLLSPTKREQCVQDCKKANYYSRTFGECSTG